ncbi:mitochondrial amidoxime reducing component 2-like [Copidosoma floridanum]|uniref:mitochondrial amidoxime reducing component 2-like n=1 Tax=Copidosoma floridanum TaxID=29053 RepID=UPI0006C9B683|nr:mitochondrial amidoxime reducing component 2-like [Copidosoma floridanum]
MNELQTFFIGTGSMTLLSFIMWYRNRKITLKEDEKQNEKILSSPDASWKQVGKVKEIFCYPLKSGKGRSVEMCRFEERGITIDEPAVFPVRDRMFIVYEEQTGKFQTGRQHPKLLLVNLSPVDEDRAKLEANDVPTCVFDVPKNTDNRSKVCTTVTMWFGEPVMCVDCGAEVAAWISKYLTGSDHGLRLGVFLANKDRDIVGGVWEEHTRLYSKVRNEDAGLFSDLSSYMIMSEASIIDLNERLDNPIGALQLRPNLVVTGCEAYAEDEWEWIRIGSDAIIRQLKPCPRCTMTRIDPNTAALDSSYEPLKTLRSYRKIKDPEKAKFDDHAPIMGIYCGLYRSGVVRSDDDVFVYQPNCIE